MLCRVKENLIIGPYFFEDGYGHTVTVNGRRYHDMIIDSLIPIVNDMNVTNRPILTFNKTAHLSHHEAQHGNPASEINWKIDLKI